MEFTDKEKEQFTSFEAYDFDSDATFQKGLDSIPDNTNPQVLDRAKLFYYSQAVEAIDQQQYTLWKQTRDDKRAFTPPSVPFAEVVRMISQGEQVPGIRRIPEKLNEQTPSISTLKAPPKPWETQEK
ncbi:hypothetical protein J3B02_000311 [Coemansia erecta]|uniref:Uncharacterized protein n=1 Tax=Coemansia asiatica TaxID=1052880 RepID=A0A9W7XI40_9FUNG|nr:hypothetical protein LPJ64_004975 [Coemansia asiatica]KAJ2858339.1 hypothetical protein J3B02_000311 [Coemansia erecta]KAJ2870797.1 hypothetical protein FB639_004568 [Coemansia asiatica]